MHEQCEMVVDRLVVLDDKSSWGLARKCDGEKIIWIWVLVSSDEISELHYYGNITQILSEMFEAVLAKKLSGSKIRKFKDFVSLFIESMNVIKAVSSKLGEEEFFNSFYGIFLERVVPKNKLKGLIPSLEN